MKYDFDTVVNRRNTDSLKWNVAENELPMWVADMDFKTSSYIEDAVIERTKHGILRQRQTSVYTVILRYQRTGMTHTQAGGKDATISGWKTTGLCS